MHACRHSARVQAHVKFNSWELESSSGAWLDLQLTNAPHEAGADWWSTDVAVPSDAYEMNYIFSDGVGTTDNNAGLDYGTDIDGHMTRQAWSEAAPERMVRLLLRFARQMLAHCLCSSCCPW